jgi:hypothetical protein
VGVGVGLGGGPKLQLGAAVAWQAASVAAMPAMPTTPAARRKPRRLSAGSSGSEVGRSADVVTALSTGVGSGLGDRVDPDSLRAGTGACEVTDGPISGRQVACGDDECCC